MRLLKPTVTVSRFTLPAPLQGDALPQLFERRFRPIDGTTDERFFGWVPVEDYLDHDWTGSNPTYGDLLAFSLRLDTRRVSPAVLKKAVSQALAQEMVESGKAFVAKERKQEVKEQCKLRLMARAEPIPAVFDVLVSGQNVYLFNANAKVQALFADFFADTFGQPVTPQDAQELARTLLGQPDIEDDAETLGREFLTWITWAAETNLEAGGYTVTTLDRLELAGDGKSSFTTPNMDEVRTAVAHGKQVVKARLQFEGDATFTVTLDAATMTLVALKLPKTEKQDGDDAGAEAAILEREYLLSQACKAVDVLYAQWLALWMGGQWEDVDAMIQAWAGGA